MKLLLLITIAVVGYAVPQDAACAACHKTQSEKHARNAMSRALYTVVEAEILEKHPKLEFQLGKYSYLIERRGKESFYRVSDGKDKIELALRFAFGQGAAGQTYVFEHQGQLFESRVSFFKELG
ncbi:MAG: hypothetical protein NTW74_13295, partial [Acidobacteria bacterium]|nr:hypothetical protein [Acidobacteriota bacterium]